ncbi:MAG: sulfatase-like hydrolase/transferase [Oscillospiraceae bacterium]|jgi:phosphoglycerol transferase MdoB-like AlkP superfamily enzyme|nr:sulfatase-like hydrolase/transferase [Oscillospiraceae bacterium]
METLDTPLSRGARLRRAPLFTYVSLAALGVATGLFSLLLATSIYGLPMFWTYFSSPLLILLNLLPPVLLIFAVWFISGRAWIAFLIPAFLVLVGAGVDFFKIQIRGDPLMAEDLAIIGEAGIILKSYSLQFNWKLLAGALFLAGGTVWSALLCRHTLRRRLIRALGSVLSAALLFTLTVTVYMSDAAYERVNGGYSLGWATYNEDFITRGFVYPFLHSVKNAFPRPPEGYSKSAAAKILDSYAYDDIPDDKKVNVISVMLEAYCDLSEFPGITLTTDVYDKWHALQSESVSGNLVDNIFAGGTIDTERLFLTGYTELRNMRRDTESYLYYLKDQGYAVEGFHSGDGWYYDRDKIHGYIGFDDYLFLEDFESTDRTDRFFFKTLRDMYDNRDESVPYFNHSLTFQNHGAYYTEFAVGPDLLARGDLTEESFNILNNYLTGIYDTTERIYDFVNSLRDDPEPVVLLFYGDHKPWLGNAESVYLELGVDMDPSGATGFYNMYTTPYIIWANDAAKKAVSGDFTGDGGYLSPGFLMNKLFSLCSWGGDEYAKAANAFCSRSPVINIPTGYFLEDGALSQTLTPPSAELLRELKIAEYYRRTNFAH